MLLRHNEARLSLKTVLILANQMLARIERFHTKGFLHRDIKPHNFTMGWGKSGVGGMRTCRGIVCRGACRLQGTTVPTRAGDGNTEFDAPNQSGFECMWHTPHASST